MRYVGLQDSWRALFFGAFRRQPLSKNYRYKYAASRIKRMVLNSHRKGLTSTESSLISLPSDRQIFTSPIHDLREAILKDIHGPPGARIKVIRKGMAGQPGKDENLVGVLSWQNVAPIFAHPLDPILGVEATDSSLKYSTTLRLSSREGDEKLLRVSWPNLAYSKSCRGIGVTKEKFHELVENVEFVNPSNDQSLPVYQVEEVPEGCDAIGLFPSYVPSQRQYFTGLELCGALIRGSLCSRSEVSKLKAHISSSSQDPNGITKPDAVEQSLGKNHFQTLKQLMDASNRCRLLWSSASDKDKTCPGDIIRCTLLSQKVDLSQLIEEYCKHYILFGLVSQASRIERAIDQSISYAGKELKFSPMDLFVWQELQKLNEIALPTSISEMFEYKEHMDRFTELLSGYYFGTIAEMKASSRTYSANGNDVPRAVPTLKILHEVVSNCKGFSLFYPNLSLFAAQALPKNPILEAIDSPSLANQEPDLSLGSKAVALFKHITQLENMMYRDSFNIDTGLEIEPIAPLKVWKIVIVSKNRLPLELERALLFSSRVYTECVTDLEKATLIRHASCESRKMIDEDTFVFLYRLQRPPKVDRAQLATEIIDRLEEASETNHT